VQKEEVLKYERRAEVISYELGKFAVKTSCESWLK
jgi:hypothetical protein